MPSTPSENRLQKLVDDGSFDQLAAEAWRERHQGLSKPSLLAILEAASIARDLPCLEMAFAVLQKRFTPSHRSYEVVIRGLANCGRASAAVTKLFQMETSSLGASIAAYQGILFSEASKQLDKATLVCVYRGMKKRLQTLSPAEKAAEEAKQSALQAQCRLLSDPTEIEALLEQVEASTDMTASTMTEFVMALSAQRRASVAKALALYDRLLARLDPASTEWNESFQKASAAILHKAVWGTRRSTADLVLDRLKAAAVVPDAAVFAASLRHLNTHERIDLVLHVYDRLVRLGLRPDIHVFAAVLDTLAVRRKMSLVNAMESLKYILKCMDDWGVAGNQQTCRLALKTCCWAMSASQAALIVQRMQVLLLQVSQEDLTLLIGSGIRLRNAKAIQQHARTVADVVETFDVKSDPDTISGLMAAYSRLGRSHVDQVEALHDLVAEHGLVDKDSVTALLCAKAAQGTHTALTHGLNVLERLSKNTEFGHLRPHQDHFKAVMMCACRLGSFKAATQVLAMLLKRVDGGSVVVEPRRLCWFYNMVICAGRRLDSLEEVDRVYTQMRQRRVRPDGYTLSNMVRHCLRTNGSDHALRLFRRIREDGARFHRNACAVVVPEFLPSRQDQGLLHLLQACRDDAGGHRGFLPSRRTYDTVLRTLLHRRSWDVADAVLQMALKDDTDVRDDLVQAVKQRRPAKDGPLATFSGDVSTK